MGGQILLMFFFAAPSGRTNGQFVAALMAVDQCATHQKSFGSLSRQLVGQTEKIQQSKCNARHGYVGIWMGSIGHCAGSGSIENQPTPRHQLPTARLKRETQVTAVIAARVFMAGLD